MAVTFAEFPVREPIAGSFLINDRWRIWLRDLLGVINTNTNKLASVSLDGQTASIVSTPFAAGSLSPGQYQVNAFTHVTAVDPVSSSLSVQVSFTHDTTVLQQTSVAMTGNLVTSNQGTPFVIDIDAGTSVSWSTTYASNTPGAMAYSIALSLLSVNV